MQNIFSSYLLVLVYFLSITTFYSQNLVPNGGFENHFQFDFTISQPNASAGYILNWKEYNLWETAYCQNDIIKRYGYEAMKQVPFYNFDTTNVFDGRAMVKLNYEESCPVGDTGCTSYLHTKLLEPLELGEVYEVSMWVYYKLNPAADTAMYSRIGMYLTRHPIPKADMERMISSNYFFANKIFPGQWCEIKWYIRALCSMQYLTIGMFRDSAFHSLFRQIYNPMDYFVDNVSIKKIHEDSLSAEIHCTPYCEFYEKEHKQQVLNSITSLDLRFESNSSKLDASDQLELDSFYQANLERKDKIFVIIGHTDSETAENVILSKSRAESASTYLNIKYKVNKQSMLTFGLGSSYPISDNATATGRLQNRRTTIRTSDLTISQLFYRKGLEYLQTDSIGKANIQFARWIKMVPIAKKVEMLVDPRLIKLKHSDYWKPLVVDVRKWYSLYPDSKNAFFLDSMYFEDQKYRTYSPYSLSGLIEEIDTIVLPEFKFNDQQFNQRDSLNYVTIQKYLGVNGYPEISKVGRRQSRALGYIILHYFDSLTFERYIPVVKNRCMEGEAEWDVFAKMTDKLCIIKNELQVYGTQYDRSSSGQLILYKIDDIDKVNYRRMRIGLAPTTVPE